MDTEENRDFIEYVDDGTVSTLPTPYTEPTEDFAAVRTSMLSLIELGNQGLETALNILVATEQPRCIDSFSGLLKTVGDLNMKVLELHKTKTDIETAGSGNNIKAKTVTQTSNNFFAGSTDDLQRMIAEMALKGQE
jgi:hypothetical protein